MIPVGWIAPSEKCWDTNMLRRLLDGDLYPHGLQVKHHAGYPNCDGPIGLVVPGRFWAQHTDQINEAIQRFVSVLLMVTSDEEAWFDARLIEHPRVKFWIQTPRPGHEYPEGARFFGVGFTPHFNEPPTELPEKTVDVVLSAQDTHERRHRCFEALEPYRSSPTCQIVPTRGFSKGVPPWCYARDMLAAKVAPCPSGAVSVDSFRVWEALEAGAVPIVDTVSPVDGETTYWGRLFSEPVPFPVYSGAAFLPSLIDEVLNDWPAVANRVQAFWMRYKRQLSIWLREDIEALGAL